MKILLVGNYPLDRQESMLRFAEMMRRELVDRGHEVRLLSPRAVLFPRISRCDGIWKWVGYFNKFVIFPLQLRREAADADLVHVCDHSNAMYIPWLADKPHLITVNDVIAIRMAMGLESGMRVRLTGRIFQRLILRGLARCRHAVCISANTRRQLLELLPVLRERSSVAHMGQNFDYFPADAAAIESVRTELGLGALPYFLHVGSDQARKNRGQAVRIFARLLARRPELPHRLVFAGAPLGADVQPAIAQTAMAERIVDAGAVTNEQLRALYSGATALIFPSLLEGFGWPIVEAQACACTVFTSDREPMVEVGGDAAVPFDPLDASAAAAIIDAALPTLPARRDASVRNARRFSTAAMIDHYLAAYEAVRASAP